MSRRDESFLEFLLQKYKSTGKTSFYVDDYMSFQDHEAAIVDLVNRGIIYEENDIIGTITLSEAVSSKVCKYF